jgi:hypothetical protein
VDNKRVKTGAVFHFEYFRKSGGIERIAAKAVNGFSGKSGKPAPAQNPGGKARVFIVGFYKGHTTP